MKTKFFVSITSKIRTIPGYFINVNVEKEKEKEKRKGKKNKEKKLTWFKDFRILISAITFSSSFGFLINLFLSIILTANFSWVLTSNANLTVAKFPLEETRKKRLFKATRWEKEEKKPSKNILCNIVFFFYFLFDLII